MKRLSVAVGLAVLLSGCAGQSGARTDVAAGPTQSPSAAPSSASPSPSPTSASPTAPPAPVVPAGVTAGIVVFDRQTGQFVYNVNPAHRFRSASLVKLLIVLDLLWGKNAVPAADRAQPRVQGVEAFAGGRRHVKAVGAERRSSGEQVGLVVQPQRARGLRGGGRHRDAAGVGFAPA